MKINRISFSGQSNTSNLQNTKQSNTINPFFYINNSENKKKDFSAAPYRILTAVIAFLAVGITLLNLKGRKTLPDSITNIEDLGVGFNKTNKFTKTVEELKSKILYPLKCALMGDNVPAKSKNFKSGFILSNSNKNYLQEFMQAFNEQSEKLGIKCINIDETLKRNEKSKWLHKKVNEAKKLYAMTKQHTIINLGDISLLAEMRNKATKSRIESLLSKINSEKYPGVVWTAWTDKPKEIPYFYNNLPILITKLMD